MAIEVDLRAYLLTLSAVTSLVGARIRPDELDEADTYPAIVIEVPSELPLNSLDGLGGETKADVNVVCIASTRAGARALAQAVKLNGTDPGTGLAGYEGAAGSGYIDSAVLEETVSDFVREDDGSDEGVYFTELRFTIFYAEDV